MMTLIAQGNGEVIQNNFSNPKPKCYAPINVWWKNMPMISFKTNIVTFGLFDISNDKVSMINIERSNLFLWYQSFDKQVNISLSMNITSVNNTSKVLEHNVFRI